MPEVRCHNCDRPFDVKARTGTCPFCGFKWGDDATDINVAWEGLIHNTQLRLFECRDDEFQQIVGLWGPAHDGADDGIPFTRELAEEGHKRMHDAGIKCVRIMIRRNGQTAASLIVGKTDRALERGVKLARKAAKRARAVIQVIA